eukprot:CAMPEP_0202960538 /NCGR_PEP_ID=MMETSP1396-20130829/4689_1 /ASSEMBLY_ACC=CAM_ASM_000872 /TAXON_ID= /ORGANISM="Pseudokeronopsis sp., Strain Brazil" /LENGTH=147 /DNA_ID=CAMNT_0049679821 /DNA_START=2266 /DNA_END=2709 /DNA_ORIENTATION=-
MAVLTGGGYTSVEEYIANIKEKEMQLQIQKEMEDLDSSGGTSQLLGGFNSTSIKRASFLTPGDSTGSNFRRTSAKVIKNAKAGEDNSLKEGGGTGKKKNFELDLNFEDKINLGNRFQRGATQKLASARNRPSGGDSLKNSMVKTPGS